MIDLARLPLALSGGAGSAMAVVTPALFFLQGTPTVSADTGVPLQLVIQLGFLITGGGMLVYAGRLIGRWQAAQENLICQVAKVDRSNLELRTRVAKVEGVVHMMEKRTEWGGASHTEEGQSA